MPPPPGSSLAACPGLTLAGTDVAVADPVLAAADALANGVAEDDDTRAVRGAYFSSPLCSALTLWSLPGVSAGFSGWFSLVASSVLRPSFSALPTRTIPDGARETVGSCTTETDGRSSPLRADAR